MPDRSGTLPPRRVAVTGMGALSALGIGIDTTRRALYGPAPEPALPKRFATTLQAPVFEIAEKNGIGAPPGCFTNRFLMLAVEEALAQAGLSRGGLAGKKIGVCVGTTVGCQLNDIDFYAALRADKPVDRTVFHTYLNGISAEWLRRELDLRGPALTVSNACTSGADAVGIGAAWIRSGLCDMVIAAGCDEMNKVPYDGFYALGVCSSRRCRPFDAARDGLNLGEGAGVLILENAGQALRRGADVTRQVAGFGKTADAYHITSPAPDGAGLEQAVRVALEQAGAVPAEVEFIQAHGTGTLRNDAVEAQVFRRVFGREVRYLSTKGATGHTLGAAGALEAIFTLLMLEERRACASFGFTAFDEETAPGPLRSACRIDGRLALSTSLAFGGSNTVLALALDEREGAR